MEEASLIEDFFQVNAEDLTLGDEPTDLIDAFCITGPSVFEFTLALSA